MAGLYTRLIKPIHFCGDITIINFAFFFSYYRIYGSFEGFKENQYFSLLIFYNSAWIIIAAVLSAYKLYRVQNIITLLNTSVKILFVYFSVIIIFNRALNVFVYPQGFSLSSYIIIAVLIPLWRITSLLSLRIYRKRGFNYRRVVIAGVDRSSHDLKGFFNIHPEHGYKLHTIFDLKKYPSGFPQFFSELTSYCVENKIDEIYCTYSLFEIKEINQIIDFGNQHVIRVKFLPDSFGFNLKQFKVDFYDYIPIFVLSPTPLDKNINKVIKRIFDILFSLLVIILIFPWLFTIVALLIKINSHGPVFFRQKRSGLDNKDFWCWKFRTMQVNEKSDQVQASQNDPRITKIGALLRKTSLDETPQFINVLIGNMSVIGPRPHMLKHTEQYSKIIDNYMIRHFIKPGITGLAQVSGLRGETTDPEMMDKRVRMDIYYMENWSLLLDIKIIAQTIFTILRGDKNAF